MLNKKINLYLLMLIIVILVSSCTNNKVNNTSEINNVDTKIKYSEYELPDTNDKEMYFSKVKDDVLYIILENPQQDMNNFRDDSNILLYNYKTKEIIQDINLNPNTGFVDILDDGEYVYFLYENTKERIDNKSCYYLDKVNESNEVVNIEKFYGNNSTPPKLIMWNSNIYYTVPSYNDKAKIKILDNKSEDIEFVSNLQLLDGTIYRNEKNIFVLVEENNKACFYAIDANNNIKKIFLEENEKIVSFSFLNDSVVLSYQDSNDNNKEKIVDINLENEERTIYPTIPLYGFVSNEKNIILANDSNFFIHVINKEKSELKENFLTEINEVTKGSAAYVIDNMEKNNDNNFGVVLINNNLYLDVDLIVP